MSCSLARSSETSALQGHSARRWRATPRVCPRRERAIMNVGGPRPEANGSRSEAETIDETSRSPAELSAFAVHFISFHLYTLERNGLLAAQKLLKSRLNDHPFTVAKDDGRRYDPEKRWRVLRIFPTKWYTWYSGMWGEMITCSAIDVLVFRTGVICTSRVSLLSQGEIVRIKQMMRGHLYVGVSVGCR